MFRFLNNLFRDFRTTKTARPARRAPRRANLQLESLEDRKVPTTVAPLGLTSLLNHNPGGLGYTTASFTATAGSHTLAFVGLPPDGGDNTAFIGQVTINPAP
jgi:hypothetical protein